jgi:hypothetical protein
LLLVGTNRSLLDLDRSFTIAKDASVTALAVGGGRAFAMLDTERVDRIEEFDCRAETALPEPNGQSMAVIAGGGWPSAVAREASDDHENGSSSSRKPHHFGHQHQAEAHAGVEPLVDLLVGLTGARLVRVCGGEARPVSSFDSLPGRSEWGNPAGTTPDLRSIAIAEDGQWLASVHVGGVWASDDAGSSWRAIIEPDADVHEVTAARGRVAVAAAIGAGWSENRGATWQWSTEGLAASYARAVALDGDSIYVTASTGPSTTAGALYRARLGKSFEKCTRGLPQWFPFNIDTGALCARDGRVAFGTRDGTVFESKDEGSSWDVVAEHVGAVRCVELA